jgi:L-rhamnose isomerase
MIASKQLDSAVSALDRFQIELLSWGFANTGTRFGKLLQPAAAGTTEETRRLLASSILALVLSTVVVGYGNNLGTLPAH